jgi:hypothetical protein
MSARARLAQRGTRAPEAPPDGFMCLRTDQRMARTRARMKSSSRPPSDTVSPVPHSCRDEHLLAIRERPATRGYRARGRQARRAPRVEPARDPSMASSREPGPPVAETRNAVGSADHGQRRPRPGGACRVAGSGRPVPTGRSSRCRSELESHPSRRCRARSWSSAALGVLLRMSDGFNREGGATIGRRPCCRWPAPAHATYARVRRVSDVRCVLAARASRGVALSGVTSSATRASAGPGRGYRRT